MPYKNKNKQRQSQNKSYLKNKKTIVDRRLSTRLINRKYIENYKLNKSCSCGEKEPCCLDFHHVDKDNKTVKVSTAIRRLSINKIKKEIEKCIILCSNCHRKLHLLPSSR